LPNTLDALKNRSTLGFGMQVASTCTTSSMEKLETMSPAGRTNSWPFHYRSRFWIQKYWKPVLEVVRDRLLTPFGLRSLSRESHDYKSKYFGDLRARDAAYHQGTVWAWLIGPFVDAWLRVNPGDHAGARQFLEGFIPHLDDGCVGSINEIFDARAAVHAARLHCPGWSVAEVLRSWVKTVE
jgi:glycogen debranching enzyme